VNSDGLELDFDPTPKADDGVGESPTAADGRIAGLAVLGPVEYDKVRQQEAQTLGIRVSTLDGEVAKLRSNGNDADIQGKALFLKDPEPWPDPVDGDALLVELVAFYGASLTLPPGAELVLPLWTLFAHAHDAFQVSPNLAFTSPVPGCGKSWSLVLLGAVTPRPLPSANVTTAAVYRTIEKYGGPTFLLDEADTYIKDRDELRGVLNSGWLRPQAYIVRCDGDDHEPRLFSTWGPKAIASIGKLPSTLSDRCLEIPMDKQTPAEEKARQGRKASLEGLRAFEPLRRKCWRWAQDHREALRKAPRPGMPPGIANRRADNCRPLLAIADAIGGEWTFLARGALLELFGIAGGHEQEIKLQLLTDISVIFRTAGAEALPTKDLLAQLVEIEDSPWGEWGKSGKPLSAHGLAQLLKGFRIYHTKVRIGRETPWSYERKSFEEAFARYLSTPTPLELEQVEHANENAALAAFRIWNRGRQCSRSKNAENPVKMRLVPDVPVQNPGPGEEGGRSPRQGP